MLKKLVTYVLLFSLLAMNIGTTNVNAVSTWNGFAFHDIETTRYLERYVGSEQELVVDSELPDGIKKVVIQSDCFNNTDVTSVEIKESIPLYSIEGGAFSNAPLLNCIFIRNMSVGIAPKIGLPTAGVSIICFKDSSVDYWCQNNGAESVIYIPRLTLEGSCEHTYDGSRYELEAKNTGGYVTDLEVVYKKKGSSVYTLTAPRDAGEYYVKARGYSDAFGTLESETQILTINKKQVYVENLEAEDKTYDGTTDATLVGGNIKGIIDQDLSDVHCNFPTHGVFSTSNAGKDLDVTPDEITLEGDRAENYTVTPVVLKASINKKSLLLSNVVIQNKIYDGNTKATVKSYNLEGLVDPSDFNIGNLKFEFDTKDTGTNKLVRLVDRNLNKNLVQNYEFKINQTAFVASISKAPLSVVGDERVVYSNESSTPDYSYTISGWQGNDNSKSDKAFSAPLLKVEGNQIIPYGGVAGKNYYFVYSNGCISKVNNSNEGISLLLKEVRENRNTIFTIYGALKNGNSLNIEETRFLEGKYSLESYERAKPCNTFTVKKNDSYITCYVKDASGKIYYKHIYCTVLGFDKKKPVIVVKQPKLKTKKRSISVYINVTDDVKIKSVKLDNKSVKTFSFTKVFKKNGKHTIIAVDTSGNKTVKSFTISKIDRKAPTIKIKKHKKYYLVTFKDNAQKKGLSIRYCKKYKTAKYWSHAKKVKKSVTLKKGKYTIFVKDNAGNLKVKKIKVKKLNYIIKK